MAADRRMPTRRSLKKLTIGMTDLITLSWRFFNKIKDCRPLATRYAKRAANSLAFVQLASIRLWLRVL
jgi:transposase